MMKKIKLIFFISQLIYLNSFCQITIDYSNFISIGDSIVEHYDSMPNESITPGDKGENITWNFKNLESDFKDTLNIVATNTTPFSDFFLRSKVALCMSSTNSTYMFFNTQDNQLKLDGVAYFSNNKKIINKENRIILKYPLNYLDEGYQVFKKEKIRLKDSIKIKTTSEYHYKVDAWGDLKLPTGIFFSLRVKRSTKITESYYRYINFKWNKYKEKVFPNITYEWWTDDPKAKHYIAYLVMDSNNKKVIHASFIPAIPFKRKIEKIAHNKIIVYPNPTQNFVNINLFKNKNYINIYSTKGQLLYSKIHNSGKTKINVSSFSNGVYFFVVKSKYGKIIGSGKFFKI